MLTREKTAIKKLEDAFKECKKLGIQFAGMDGSIIYATKSALDTHAEEEAHRGYCPVANVNQQGYKDGTGIVNTHDTYQDSGGW